MIPQVYLHTLQDHVPLLLMVSVCFMVFSMDNKWHWFLLLSLVPCIVGIYWLYNPSPYINTNVLQTILLIILLTTLLIAVFLDPQTNNTHQFVFRGIGLFILSCTYLLIVFSSAIRNTHVEMLAILLAAFSFILTFCWISIQNDHVRSTLYMTNTLLFLFFVMYYTTNATPTLFRAPPSSQKQQVVQWGGMEIKPLPKMKAV